MTSYKKYPLNEEQIKWLTKTLIPWMHEHYITDFGRQYFVGKVEKMLHKGSYNTRDRHTLEILINKYKEQTEDGTTQNL